MPASRDRNDMPSLAESAFVLDDSQVTARIVCEMLKTCGLRAQHFTAPRPFFAELKKAPPGLVVLDLSLGQSDAVEIIRHLEARKFQGKVLLISAHDQTTLNEITLIGTRHGLSMLPPLKKPFGAADINRRLAADEPTPAAHVSPRLENDGAKKPAVQFTEALQNGWLEVWYQAKVELHSFTICGAEALIRARHPVYGVVTPNDLLPPAGDLNYAALTSFVLARAMADWKLFPQHNRLLKLSINAPASLIQSPGFMAMVRSTLPTHTKFPGMTIELTEDEAINDSDWAFEVASQLKLYGIDLSIDDFGSGYASLARLAELPFAEVKIDRSFVSGCSANSRKRGLCQAAIDVAHRFGARACAEGVETLDDLRAVREMRCDTAQGFLFAKPLPLPEFMTILGRDLRNKLSAALAAIASQSTEQIRGAADDE